jgi:HEAT repeat protein
MTDTPAILDTSHHQRDQRTSPTRAFRWACISGLGLFCAPVLVLALSGCGEDRDVIFSTTPAVTAEANDRAAMLADIASLANAKDLKNPDHDHAYNKALDALIVRSSRIEPSLIEALAGNDDWGVRYGVVNVLKAIGTRRCIEPLMGVLEDPQPLVALSANNLLCALTKHVVIPAAGEPPRDGLVAVPLRLENDLALDAEEKLWSAWHGQYRAALRTAWRTWWEANKATTVVE